jgi:hypothetical protein
MTGDSSDRPSWPALPLDPDCRESVDPRRDVAEVVRWLWTDFDPDQRPNGWAAMRSLLLEDGKSDEEIRSWSYEDIKMFFHVNWRRLRQEKVGTIHFGMATHTPSTQTFEMPSGGGDSSGSNLRKPTTHESLLQLMATPKGRMELVTAGTSGSNAAEGVRVLIGKSASAVKGDPLWPQILTMIDAYRANSRVDLLERAEKAMNREKY